VPPGGQAPPWVDRPLTGSNHHRLRTVGSWLDLEHVPMVLLVQLCQVCVIYSSFLLFFLGLNCVNVVLWAHFDVFSCWSPINKYFSKTCGNDEF